MRLQARAQRQHDPLTASARSIDTANGPWPSARFLQIADESRPGELAYGHQRDFLAAIEEQESKPIDKENIQVHPVHQGGRK